MGKLHGLFCSGADDECDDDNQNDNWQCKWHREHVASSLEKEKRALERLERSSPGEKDYDYGSLQCNGNGDASVMMAVMVMLVTVMMVMMVMMVNYVHQALLGRNHCHDPRPLLLPLVDLSCNKHPMIKLCSGQLPCFISTVLTLNKLVGSLFFF